MKKLIFFCFFCTYTYSHNSHEHFKNFPLAQSFFELYKNRETVLPKSSTFFRDFFEKSLEELILERYPIFSADPIHGILDSLNVFNYDCQIELMANQTLGDFTVGELILVNGRVSPGKYKKIFSMGNTEPRLIKRNLKVYKFNEIARSYFFKHLPNEAIAYLFRNTYKRIFERTGSKQSFESIEFSVGISHFKNTYKLDKFIDLVARIKGSETELGPKKVSFYFSYGRRKLFSEDPSGKKFSFLDYLTYKLKARTNHIKWEENSFNDLIEKEFGFKIGVDIVGGFVEWELPKSARDGKIYSPQINLEKIMILVEHYDIPLRIHAFEGANDRDFYTKALFPALDHFKLKNENKRLNIIFGHGAFLNEKIYQELMKNSDKYSYSVDYNFYSNSYLQPISYAGVLKNYLEIKKLNEIATTQGQPQKVIHQRIGSDSLGIWGYKATVEYQERNLQREIKKLKKTSSK